MKKCMNCGNVNPDDANNCLNCGQPLTQFNQTEYNQFNPNQNNTQYQQQPPAIPQPPAHVTQKKKKGKGCLTILCIAILIIIFLVVCSAIFGGDSESNNTNLPTVEEQINENKTDLDAFTIEEKTIYDKNNVIIKVVDTNISATKIGLNFYIENNSDMSLSFCVHSSAVNNIMTEENIYSMSTDIAAGKKANTSFTISRTWFEKNNITQIKSFQLLFWAYDNEASYKEFESNVITIKTNHYNDKTIKLENAIYDQDGIQVYKLNNNDKSITFAVKNTNSYYIDYDLQDVSINNWSMDTGISVYDQPLFAESISLFTIEVDSDFKSTNKISQLENIEFKLEYRIKGAHKNSKTTKIIKAKL